MADPAVLKKIADQISRDGQLPGGNDYRQLLNEARQTPGVLVQALRTEGAPEDIKQTIFEWDRKDNAIILHVWVNAAISLGVCIDNIIPGDTITFQSGDGIASFKDSKGNNEKIESLVALAAAGASIAAASLGVPQAQPVIAAGAKLAVELFGGLGDEKQRDIFGQDPKSGHKARQEGGILITLPIATGPFYSGESESRWIRKPGDRTDDNLPGHVRGAFFPIRGHSVHNTRNVGQARGQIYITAWDWKYKDNGGFYHAVIGLEQAGPLPLPEGIAEGDVIKGPDSPEVFLVEGGRRSWIPDEVTFLSRWTWDQLKVVPQDVLEAIPRGPDLASST